MLAFAERVRVYSNGMDQQQFEADELRYDAILRNLELIGEAATHIPDDVRRVHSSVPEYAKVIAVAPQEVNANIELTTLMT